MQNIRDSPFEYPNHQSVLGDGACHILKDFLLQRCDLGQPPLNKSVSPARCVCVFKDLKYGSIHNNK